MSTRYSWCWSVVCTLAYVCPLSCTCHYAKLQRLAAWDWCARPMRTSSLVWAFALLSLHFSCKQYQSSMSNFTRAYSRIINKPKFSCLNRLFVTLPNQGSGKACLAYKEGSMPLMYVTTTTPPIYCSRDLRIVSNLAKSHIGNSISTSIKKS